MTRFDPNLDIHLPLLTHMEQGVDRASYNGGVTNHGVTGASSSQEAPSNRHGQVPSSEPSVDRQLTSDSPAELPPAVNGSPPVTPPSTSDSRLSDWWISPQPDPTTAASSSSDPTRTSSLAHSERGFLPVLKNRSFLVLWSGQVFSQLADKVYLVLMIMIISNRFQPAGQTISGWVSAIMIAFTIPAMLFGSIAGVFVDHWPKKGVLSATNLLRGGLVLALPPMLWLSQGWSPLAGIPVGFIGLLGITFLVSTLTQFFAPAEQSVIPLIVDRRHLLSANSLYTTTMMASVIIGFAVGEPLLAIADTFVTRVSGVAVGKEVLVGVSYAIAGLVLLGMQTNERLNPVDQPPPRVWDNIRDGLRYLKQKERVRAAFIQLIILFSIFAALAVLAVRLAEVMPALKSSQFGFLLAAGGVGMAIGAFGVGHYGQRFSHGQLSLIGSTGMGVSLVGLSLFTTQLIPALLILASLGAFASLVGVPMQTAIQEETPEEMRGKVFGLQNNAINIALSLPLALVGVAETYVGLRVVFLALALMAIAGGLLTWWVSRQQSTVIHRSS